MPGRTSGGAAQLRGPHLVRLRPYRFQLCVEVDVRVSRVIVIPPQCHLLDEFQAPVAARSPWWPTQNMLLGVERPPGEVPPAGAGVCYQGPVCQGDLSSCCRDTLYGWITCSWTQADVFMCSVLRVQTFTSYAHKVGFAALMCFYVFFFFFFVGVGWGGGVVIDPTSGEFKEMF